MESQSASMSATHTTPRSSLIISTKDYGKHTDSIQSIDSTAHADAGDEVKSDNRTGSRPPIKKSSFTSEKDENMDAEELGRRRSGLTLLWKKARLRISEQRPTFAREQYRYASLTEPDQIRVLELLPGSQYDVIKCRLVIVSLDSGVSYTALSYTWGNPKKTKNIECEGKKIEVTVNLESALRRLRDTHSVRRLWADAICINQKDVREKEQQVVLMRNIYKNAKDVAIWLGPDNNGQGKLAFQELEEYRGKNMTLPEYRDYDADTSRTRALQDLLEWSWFFRVWIIQEAGLAKSATVICGPWEFEWDDFYWIMFHMTYEIPLRPRDYLPGARNVLKIHSWDINQRYEYRDGPSESTQSNRERSIEFLRLLSQARSFEATDPRDKVFALLGHSSALIDGQNGKELIIRPNYSIPFPSVYQQIAVRILQLSHSLDLLAHVQHTHPTVMDQDVPSWVPAWHIDLLDCYPLGRDETQDETEFDVGLDRGILKVKGTFFDSIDLRSDSLFAFPFYISPVIPDPEANPVRDLWEMIVAEPQLQQGGVENYIAGGTVEDAFSDTLTVGRRPFGPQYGGWYYAYLFKVLEDYPRLQEMLAISDEFRSAYDRRRELNGAYKFMTAAAEVCHARKFFITGKGYFGLCPAVTSADDLIYVLSGCRFPCVLRRTDDHFRFVGLCYISGLNIHEILATGTEVLELR